jgi:hypothetical protein
MEVVLLGLVALEELVLLEEPALLEALDELEVLGLLVVVRRKAAAPATIRTSITTTEMIVRLTAEREPTRNCKRCHDAWK